MVTGLMVSDSTVLKVEAIVIALRLTWIFLDRVRLEAYRSEK
jgi:hypothetical protein